MDALLLVCVCVGEVCYVYTDLMYEHSDAFLKRKKFTRAVVSGCSQLKQAHTSKHKLQAAPDQTVDTSVDFSSGDI